MLSQVAAARAASGDRERERPGSRSHATPGQVFAQLFQGAGDALLRRIIAHTQRSTHHAKVLVLKKALHQRVVIGFRQLGHGGVKHGPQAFPIGSAFRDREKLFHGKPFACMTPEFIAPKIERLISSAPA